MIRANHVRDAKGRCAAQLLPMDCPYCQKALLGAPRGWVCSECRSTVGIDDALAV